VDCYHKNLLPGGDYASAIDFAQELLDRDWTEERIFHCILGYKKERHGQEPRYTRRAAAFFKPIGDSVQFFGAQFEAAGRPKAAATAPALPPEIADMERRLKGAS
jgi:hypothetical protein